MTEERNKRMDNRMVNTVLLRNNTISSASTGRGGYINSHNREKGGGVKNKGGLKNLRRENEGNLISSKFGNHEKRGPKFEGGT